jgi:hypothetical protein
MTGRVEQGTTESAHEPRPGPPDPSARNRAVLLLEVSSCAVATAIAAAIGVSGLPVWAIVAMVAAFTAVIALWTKAAIGPVGERVRSLWGASLVLAGLIAGILIYVNGPTVPFVNYVANKTVTLSGVAGQPPSTEFDAPTMGPEVENSANCYVVVHGQIWLEFGHNGWAPAADFHPAPDAHSALPRAC